MKYLSVFVGIVLGIALSVQPVQAEDLLATESENADSAVVEEVAPDDQVEDGETTLDEGEVTERGVSRFKLPPRKRILIPKKPAAGTNKFRLKRRPLAPSGAGSNTPPRGEGTPPVEPPNPSEPPGPIEPANTIDPPPQCVWHTSDIIDQRIDISAQERLMAMMSRGGEERLDASAMIGAVKQGILAGVLLAPRKAVSDRGQRMTPPKGWWELIPQGQLGTCLQEPLGESPMILYRDKNGETNLDPSVIEHTLRTMWGQCGMPTPVPACSYLVDLHKPPPQPGSTDEHQEGHGLSEVMVSSGGQPLSGVFVVVKGSLKVFPDGHPRENEPGPPFVTSLATNSEGIATFFLPPNLEKGISVDVIGPPGFSNASVVVGGFILDRRLMIELNPREPPTS